MNSSQQKTARRRLSCEASLTNQCQACFNVPMDTNPNLIIDSLGGTCAVAKICDVSAQAVSQWRVNGIPKPWMMLFKEKRPDLFSKKATKKVA